ncbi:beta-phosphoglucomutase [Sphingopyxis sp. BSN-002]|uniref:beta-phosphoglucomutase n=1 Tax=Sphingopyxis sp. BSN-002 TaxID=2911495 RepID=UPI001EDC31EE|nr:beta-phosphoglucomutase [Sphingopyxis sp. BSN-002]UKK85825.1 beta-phosphoglucomutase [Sphingopyxis sp. BSN-002]
MRLVRRGADATGAEAAALFALANGLCGVEGVIDECAVAPCAYLSDAYVSRPITYHESFPGYATATDTRVACPSPLLVRLHIDGQPVDFGTAEPTLTESVLDFATGTLQRVSRWTLGNGRTLEIAVERIVPLGGHACVASRIHIRPVDFAGGFQAWLTYGTEVDGVSGVEADDPRISARMQPQWTISSPLPGDNPSVTRFAQDVAHLAYRQHVACPTAQVAAVHAGHVVRGEMVAGDTLTIDRVVAMACARGRPVDLVAVEGATTGFDAIAEGQRSAVQAFWGKAGFAIDGDDALAEALRFDLFQLHQSASRDPNHSIGAKGLTGEGYEGHYFWDAETFMLPVLALQAPERAKTLLAYRVGKLDRARAHAKALGHSRGALYPWRTIAGDECSSHYPTGSAQYHINGDIAYALALYIAATGDEAFRAEAAEMLFETARMWMEIGAFDPRRGGAFCIHGVTGPDEYSALVDNDFYTNAIARRHLAYAADTADWLRARHEFSALAAAIDLKDGEVAGWRAAADAMWLPVDPALGVNPQDDAFLGRPELPGLAASGDRHGPLLMRYHPMILFRHQVAKQGNVVQAMAMDLVEMPLSRQRRNFDYYSRVTTHDSTLSSVSFAIAAARLGDETAALRFMHECAFVDLENRHGNTSHGLHMAALAGSWLILAQGWGGLRLDGAAPAFRPQLPSAWNGYSFRLQWRGSTIELAVDAVGCTYRLLAGEPLDVVDHGRALRIDAQPVMMLRPSRKGVIFDLDGVLTDTAEDHYQAWQALADAHGFAFDREVNHRLKGVDRGNSLRLILEHAGAEVDAERFDAMLAEKNDIYRERLAAYSPANLFAGVSELFDGLRAAGLKIGLASASRNAPDVVRLLGIADEFDFIADAGAVVHAKPAPDIFLACADGMGLSPDQCIGVEDARAGITAIHAAGMAAIGIGSEEALPDAEFNVPAIGALTVDRILSTEREAAPRAGLSNRPDKVEEISC